MILSFLQSWATHFQINPSVLPAEKCVNLQSRGRTMVERNCVEKAVNTLVRDLLRLLALWVFLGGIFGANNIQKQPKTSKKHPKTINGSTEYVIYCVYIYRVSLVDLLKFLTFFDTPILRTAWHRSAMAAQESRRRGCWVPGVLHRRVSRKFGGDPPERALKALDADQKMPSGHFTVLENEPLDRSWGISYIELAVKHGHFPWPW